MHIKILSLLVIPVEHLTTNKEINCHKKCFSQNKMTSKVMLIFFANNATQDTAYIYRCDVRIAEKKTKNSSPILAIVWKTGVKVLSCRTLASCAGCYAIVPTLLFTINLPFNFVVHTCRSL